jgi:hydroxymethylglutaryl-CoA reductase (NADPH)
VGKYAYIRFAFDTQDAMGMNMVTIATQKIIEFIEKEIGIPCISLSGNFCVDKKVSWQNFINHRGIKAWAEVVLSEETLKTTLKTTAEKMYQVWMAKCMLGSAIAGAIGFNAQAANVIAALFISTGQDVGHVGEASMAVTTAEMVKNPNGNALYVSVYLPDLMVGTVGGGTGLATQREALEMLGVAGGNEGKNALRFAEIICAAVLAGEVSLLASLEEGTLASAHAQLGRGRI